MTPDAARSVVSQHATHLIAVAIPVVMVVVALVWDSVRTRWRRRHGRPESDRGGMP